MICLMLVAMPRSPMDCVRLLCRTGGNSLTFLRRPPIGLGARAAHQHRPLAVAEAVSLEEGLDGLLVVDDGERSSPVGAPQTAVETPGIEHAGERIPDVREGIRLPGQRTGTAHFDHRVWAL